MAIFEVGSLRAVKFWVDEERPLPPCRPGTATVRTWDLGAMRPLPRRVLGVEAFLPQGAIARYVFLGATIEGTETQHAEVTVTPSLGPRLSGTPGDLIEAPVCGIPEWALPSILDGARRSFDEAPFSGRVIFLHGAATDVGSSPDLFDRAAYALLGLARETTITTEHIHAAARVVGGVGPEAVVRLIS